MEIELWRASQKISTGYRVMCVYEQKGKKSNKYSITECCETCAKCFMIVFGPQRRTSNRYILDERYVSHLVLSLVSLSFLIFDEFYTSDDVEHLRRVYIHKSLIWHVTYFSI